MVVPELDESLREPFGNAPLPGRARNGSRELRFRLGHSNFEAVERSTFATSSAL